uniref:Uncharacterized protein n=1 Tax=Opuntia streptacantha TaxID=393608 RepID=A0A7C9CTX4_OPUST
MLCVFGSGQLQRPRHDDSNARTNHRKQARPNLSCAMKCSTDATILRVTILMNDCLLLWIYIYLTRYCSHGRSKSQNRIGRAQYTASQNLSTIEKSSQSYHISVS